MSVKYDEYFTKASKEFGVDKSLLIAVANAESGFNEKAVSSAGAVGVMQLMPTTAREMGVVDLYDPEQNIRGGARYLSHLLEEFDGNTELALSAYNAGPSKVKESGAVLSYTEDYVNKVMKTYKGNNSTVGAVLGGMLVTNSKEGYELEWWGDIVRVVLILLLIILMIVFLCITAGKNVTKASGEVLKDVVDSVVKGGGVNVE